MSSSHAAAGNTHDSRCAARSVLLSMLICSGRNAIQRNTRDGSGAPIGRQIVARDADLGLQAARHALATESRPARIQHSRPRGQ
jgi:hypothetical protein